jgi:hypothetical protein
VAVNVAELALAATVSEAGTVREVLLSERATTAPPVGADWFSVTVQVVEAPELTLLGLQARAVTSMGATKVKVAVWVAPFSVAVMVADWVVVNVPAVAVNVAEFALAATTTDAGTVKEALLSERATAAPPVGAAWLRVTVHVLAAPGLTLAGLHARAETSVGATRLSVALSEAPLRIAVIVADWVVVMVPTVPLNVAVVPFAGTVTDAGMVSAGLLPESPTAAPPVGAA